MTNKELNNCLLEYTKENITPKEEEWSFISGKYQELLNILEDKNCFQSGSCARFTAIKPINDLDVIWIISDEVKKSINSNSLNLQDILNDLARKLEDEYEKIGVDVDIKPQTHSVGIYFGESESEFSIDIVPAKNTGEKNEFDDYILEVPEILFYSKKNRIKLYKSKKEIKWKKSDPKGYKEQIKRLHKKNDNLRKVIRFLKKWRWNCKRNYPNFPIKSFHLELIVKDIFEQNTDINFLNAVKLFYEKILDYIGEPQFLDRADNSVHIDEYLKDVDDYDKHEVLELSGMAMVGIKQLEKFDVDNNIDDEISTILSAKDQNEKFIYDSDFGYKVAIIEDLDFKINGKVIIKNLKKRDTLREYYLRDNYYNPITIGNEIYFYISDDSDVQGYSDNIRYYWKVKNRGREIINKEGKREPRGEITLNQTASDPEATAYNGIHFVECYAIFENKCIAYDRLYIYIKKD